MTRLRPYAILILAVLAVFAGTAGFSYIGLDDAGYTFRNPFVATGLSLSNIVECFTNFRHGGIWMPVTYISYMIDIEASRLLGIDLSTWMHLVNVSFHLLNTLLLLFLAHRLSAAFCGVVRPAAAFFAVAFWAVHPLRVEPVAWIVCRKEMLWVFFSLLGLVLWLKSFAAGARPRGEGMLRFGTLLLFIAACLSKPSAMCFPVLAGALHLLLYVGAGDDSGRFRVTKPLAAFYAAMIAVAGGTAFAAAYSQTHVAGQEAVALFAAPLHHRIVHALSALGFYIRATVWPSGLHVDCRIVEGIMPLGGVSNLIAFAVAAVALVLTAVHVRAWRMSRIAAAFWFSFVWFIVPLVPTLGILGSFGIEAHADRFTYLPGMAVALAAVLMPVPGFIAKRVSGRTLRRTAWLAVIAYAAVAVRQTGFWRDDHTAHLRALACDGACRRCAVCAVQEFRQGHQPLPSEPCVASSRVCEVPSSICARLARQLGRLSGGEAAWGGRRQGSFARQARDDA